MYFSFSSKYEFSYSVINRILIDNLQEEIEKQFDVKEREAVRHSYGKYHNWDKVQYKIPGLQKSCPQYLLSFSFLLFNNNKKNYPQCLVSFSFLLFLFFKIGFALKIVAWMEKMLDKHPKMISRIKIGTTVEDNPLYVLKVQLI